MESEMEDEVPLSAWQRFLCCLQARSTRICLCTGCSLVLTFIIAVLVLFVVGGRVEIHFSVSNITSSLPIGNLQTELIVERKVHSIDLIRDIQGEKRKGLTGVLYQCEGSPHSCNTYFGLLNGTKGLSELNNVARVSTGTFRYIEINWGKESKDCPPIEIISWSQNEEIPSSPECSSSLRWTLRLFNSTFEKKITVWDRTTPVSLIALKNPISVSVGKTTQLNVSYAQPYIRLLQGDSVYGDMISKCSCIDKSKFLLDIIESSGETQICVCQIGVQIN